MHGQQVTNGGKDSDLTMGLLGVFVRKRLALSNGQWGLPAKVYPWRFIGSQRPGKTFQEAPEETTGCTAVTYMKRHSLDFSDNWPWLANRNDVRPGD
jgi:hypothetical protein